MSRNDARMRWKPPGVHAHKQVLHTALGMAYELYDLVMRDNEAYATWKRLCPDLTPEFLERKFVELMAPRLLEAARATLASLLTTPINEHLKMEIHDALVKDNRFVAGRMRAKAARLKFEEERFLLDIRRRMN